MATAPNFIGTQHAEDVVQDATGNANIDGVTGSHTVIATGGPNGTVITEIAVAAAADVTEGWVRVYKKKGSFAQLKAYWYVPPTAHGTKVPPWLPPPWKGEIHLESASFTLVAAVQNSEPFNFNTQGYDH